MKKMSLAFTTATAMFVCLITALILTTPSTVFAKGEQCFIISIRAVPAQPTVDAPSTDVSMKGELDPQYLRIPKGSCVVFMDWVNQGKIKVSFKGNICATTIAGSSKIRLEPDTGCYVTDSLQMGETTSLRFMDAGDYTYEVTGSHIVTPIVGGQITVY